jgi:outer membrane lipoprotein carrier protein
MLRFNPMARLLAVFCLAVAAASPAQEQSARQQLERFTAGLETLHAQFEQQVISTDGAVQDSSSGEVWLSRPQRFRWAYGGDFPELVVADGSHIWIYDEALEQVTVRNQSPSPARHARHRSGIAAIAPAAPPPPPLAPPSVYFSPP